MARLGLFRQPENYRLTMWWSLFHSLPEFRFRNLELAEGGIKLPQELMQLRAGGGCLRIGGGFEDIGGVLKMAGSLSKLAHRVVNFNIVNVFVIRLDHALSTFASLAPQIKSMIMQIRTTTVPLVNADLTKLGATEDSIHVAAISATGVLNSIHAAIKPALARYDQAADKTAYAMDQAGKLLHSGRQGAVMNLNAAAAEIRQAIPALLAQARADLDQVHATFTNTAALTADARKLLAANQNRVAGIIRAVHSASVDLRTFAVEIRHSPWRLLYKPSPEDINNIEIYDAVRQFAQAARHLQHAADVLQAAANPQTPASRTQLHQLLRQLNTTFSQFRIAESKFWKAVK